MFLFPSNGKAFLNLTPVFAYLKADQFLFPSNGKAFLNMCGADHVAEGYVVSIPFKRDGVSELLDDGFI